MADLSFDPEPLAALERLESDHSLATVFDLVDTALDLLERDPGDDAVRPT